MLPAIGVRLEECAENGCVRDYGRLRAGVTIGRSQHESGAQLLGLGRGEDDGRIRLMRFTSAVHGYFLGKAWRRGAGGTTGEPIRLSAPSVRRSTAVSEDEPDQGESIDLSARLRAYESVKAVLANNHHVDRGRPQSAASSPRYLQRRVLPGLPKWLSNCRSGWRRPWNGVPRIRDSPRWTSPMGLVHGLTPATWRDRRSRSGLRSKAAASAVRRLLARRSRSRSCLARRTASRRPSAPSSGRPCAGGFSRCSPTGTARRRSRCWTGCSRGSAETTRSRSVRASASEAGGSGWWCCPDIRRSRSTANGGHCGEPASIRSVSSVCRPAASIAGRDGACRGGRPRAGRLRPAAAEAGHSGCVQRRSGCTELPRFTRSRTVAEHRGEGGQRPLRRGVLCTLIAAEHNRSGRLAVAGRAAVAALMRIPS